MEGLGWSEGVELVSGCLWVLWFCLEGGDVGLEVVVWFVVEVWSVMVFGASVGCWKKMKRT